MRFYTFLSSSILGLLLLQDSSFLALAAEQNQANIVFILADDLGYGDLGCYGHEIIQTPNLDRLASEGIRFTDFYCPSAVCSPSRAGTLTGRNPERIGVYSWIPPRSHMHVRDSEICIPELLKSAGYATCFVGKYHCNGEFNNDKQPQPDDQGFDYWFATHNNASPDQKNPDNFVRNGEALGTIEGYSSQIIADEAIGWMKSADQSQPFAIFVWFHATHTPLAADKPFMEMYRDYPKEATYYADATEMDDATGRILATLKELGQEENTLVVFSSDNGPAFLDHRGAAGSAAPLRERKWSLHEGGIRVPGIVRWPEEIEAGQVSDAPVGLIDLLPTFCEMTGVSIPSDRVLDGESFLPIMRGEMFSRTKPLYWQKTFKGTPNVALRLGDWKILAHSNSHQEPFRDFELFNLREDISEANNLAEKELQKLEEMSQLLESAHTSVNTEAPTWPLPAPKGKKIVGVLASSTYNKNDPVYAVDNHQETQWESAYSPNQQWLQLELKEGVKLKGMNIVWDANAAKKYKVSLSPDGDQWTVVSEVTGGKRGAKAKLDWNKQVARYLRIDCMHKNNKQWGYAIREISLR